VYAVAGHSIVAMKVNIEYRILCFLFEINLQ
jgi:hypothetical protein